ncbi:MAG: VanZ family protein [Planctomycetota bacterium]|jgi:VanZ family protein
MTLSHRKKLIRILLAFYWISILALTHIPIPQLVREAQVSDKTLHVLAYLVLVFLLWFAVNPDSKVNWRKAVSWLVFLIAAGYGVVDERLQVCISGRSASMGDFLANLVGVAGGLVLFTFLSFGPSLLMVTGIVIFGLTNLTRSNPAELLPVTNLLFHLAGHGFFAFLWIQHVNRYSRLKVPELKWLTTVAAVPVCFLLVVQLFPLVKGREFALQDVIVSLGAILAVVCIALFSKVLTKGAEKTGR